jgi:integrase
MGGGVNGHVRKHGKGWVHVIDLGRDPATGKRRQKWTRGFADKRAAQKDLRAKLTQLDAGNDPFPESLTVSTFADQWIEHLTTQGKVRDGTSAAYRQLVRLHAEPVIGEMEIRKVRPAHIQAVLDGMTRAGKAARTVAHCRAAMSSMFKLAVRLEVVTSNPVRDSEAPKKSRPNLTTPTASDLSRLIAAADGTPYELPVLLSCRTGARRGEVAGLRWQDVDLDEGTARITSTIQKDPTTRVLVRLDPKTARSRRTIHLDSVTVARLRQHRADQRERLLAIGVRVTGETPVCDDGHGGLLDIDRYSKEWPKITARAGVPAGIRLHDARHGVATVLAEANVPTELIAAQLGHADEGFTLRTYVHASNDRLRTVANVIGDALSG